MASATNPRAEADERELVITRVFNAPRDVVFKAWTDARQAKSWWGPRAYPAAHVEMDVRPGGAWRICLRSTESGEELWHGGLFREIVAPERLVFTCAWEEEGKRGLETLVTVTFAEQGGETRMTLRHAPFQTVETRDDHQEGWSSTFDRLDEHLATWRGSNQ